MKKYRAVIFDLDDTLYPEKEYVCSGFRAVAEWANFHLAIPEEQCFAELKELFDHGVRKNTFDRWLDQHRMNREVVTKLVQVYREHLPAIKPFDEVPELLSILKQTAQLGLLSDGYIISQTKKITALNLDAYFDTVILSDRWGKEAWKPNPWIYNLTLESLGVDAAQAVYVADNPAKDFLGAKRIKLSTVRLRIPSGLYANDAPPDSSYAPDAEVLSHKELAEFLLRQA